jgi:hypothetical protein
MSELNLKGKCDICNEMYPKRSITRHLSSHLKQKPIEQGKQSFHLKIEADPFFIHLVADSKLLFEELDSFLRAIWLECCGHLSSFSIGRTFGGNEVSMKKQIGNILHQGLKLEYVYDFGSSTQLDIKVEGEYSFSVKEGIQLLSRNELLELICHLCNKKLATQICSVHYDEDHLFCEKCSKKHAKECEDAEYALMPIVNSPRFGVCGYKGGMIDTARDAPFQK